MSHEEYGISRGDIANASLKNLAFRLVYAPVLRNNSFRPNQVPRQTSLPYLQLGEGGNSGRLFTVSVAICDSSTL